MSDHGLTGWIKDYEETRVPYMIHTINPPAGWTKDTDCYYLIMDLPDFKNDEVEVKVDDALGNLIVKGMRRSGENQHVKFERSFKLPEDSDVTKPVTRKLNNEMLYITVSRQLLMPTRFEFESVSKEETREECENKDAEKEKEMKSESVSKEETRGECENKDAEEEKETKSERKEGIGDEGTKERNVPKKMLEKLDQHKCILFGIFAFAFGVYVATHKLQQPPRR